MRAQKTRTILVRTTNVRSMFGLYYFASAVAQSRKAVECRYSQEFYFSTHKIDVRNELECNGKPLRPTSIAERLEAYSPFRASVRLQRHGSLLDNPARNENLTITAWSRQRDDPKDLGLRQVGRSSWQNLRQRRSWSSSDDKPRLSRPRSVHGAVWTQRSPLDTASRCPGRSVRSKTLSTTSLTTLSAWARDTKTCQLHLPRGIQYEAVSRLERSARDRHIFGPMQPPNRCTLKRVPACITHLTSMYSPWRVSSVGSTARAPWRHDVCVCGMAP